MESESWQSPKSLKKLTLLNIVNCFIKHLDPVLSERDLSNERILELFQKRVFPAITDFNDLIPTEVRLRTFFRRAIVEVVGSVKLYDTVGYSYHLFYFFIQFLMLNEVFVGNNYFKTKIDGYFQNGSLLLIIPGNPERTAIPLIDKCENFQVSKLTLIVYLCPKIIEAILKKSPNLTELKLSSINIHDEVFVSIGKFCPNLIKLKIEDLPNYKVSGIGVMKCFFRTATTLDHLKNSFDNQVDFPVSFPHLKELVCEVSKFTFSHEFGIYFYYYYASKNSLTNLLLFGDSYIKKSLLPVLTNKKVILQLKEIGLSKNILFDLLPADLEALVTYLPAIENVNLYVEFLRNYPLVLMKAIENFKHLLLRFEKVKFLSIMYRKSVLNEAAASFLSASLACIGVKLVRVTIAIGGRGSTPVLTFLQEVFHSCPSLSILNVVITDKFIIDYQAIHDATFFIPNNQLKEFYLRESNPTCEDNLIVRPITLSWIKLIEIIQESSPNLNIFGTTLYRLGRFIAERLASTVSTFYLYNDPVGRNNLEENDKFNSSHIIQMVQRFPNLRFLYLQSLAHADFVAVRDHFAPTDLVIIAFNDEMF